MKRGPSGAERVAFADSGHETWAEGCRAGRVCRLGACNVGKSVRESSLAGAGAIGVGPPGVLGPPRYLSPVRSFGKALAVTGLVSSVLALGACGDDSASTADTASPSPAATASATPTP